MWKIIWATPGLPWPAVPISAKSRQPDFLSLDFLPPDYCVGK